jgi:hypothetical protein
MHNSADEQAQEAEQRSAVISASPTGEAFDPSGGETKGSQRDGERRNVPKLGRALRSSAVVSKKPTEPFTAFDRTPPS